MKRNSKIGLGNSNILSNGWGRDRMYVVSRLNSLELIDKNKFKLIFGIKVEDR